MKRKLLSLMLALTLVCSFLPQTLVFAADDWKSPFSDVKEGSWYYDGVGFVCSEGLFKGMDDDIFQPDLNMSRAMLVTVLWRYEGEPKLGSNIFDDVPDAWYTDAVVWAASQGVVNGMGDGKFAPYLDITREQLAVILFRYAEKKMDVSKRVNLNGYPDAGSISGYALEAMRWSVAEGIIGGTKLDNGQIALDPLGSATRAQVAVMMMRFVKLMNGEPIEKPDVPPVVLHEGDLQVGEEIYSLGMSYEALTARAGTPDATLSTFAGYTCYVFGTDDYHEFLLAGVSGGKVVMLCSSGSGFVYMNHRMGDSGVAFSSTSSCMVEAYYDKNQAGNPLHCVRLTTADFRYGNVINDATLAGEAKINFFLVNAFREYHNTAPLVWSEPAVAAAQLHSQDMAEHNYFDHVSLDGRTPSKRMEDQGIAWRACGENIQAGWSDALEMHNGWVNSAGHRSNLLNGQFSYLGVGFAYSAASTYKIYATQDFWA